MTDMSIIMHVCKYHIKKSVEHALCRDGNFGDCAKTLTQVKLQLPICVSKLFWDVVAL